MSKNMLLRKRNGEKIVTTNGVFDILHPGHIYSFKMAKKFGDYLIVCMNSDISVKKIKGEKRPLNDEIFRRTMLEAIEYIDEVMIFHEENPINILERIKPDVHVKSKSGYLGIEGDTVKKNGGKLVLIPDRGEYSTTKLIRKWSKKV